MSYDKARELHDNLVGLSTGPIVRMQNNDGVWWVEYADRVTGKWTRIEQ